MSSAHICSTVGAQMQFGNFSRTRAQAYAQSRNWLSRAISSVDCQDALDALYHDLCLLLVDIDYHFPAPGDKYRSATGVATDALRLIDDVMEKCTYPNLVFLESSEDEDDGDTSGDLPGSYESGDEACDDEDIPA